MNKYIKYTTILLMVSLSIYVISVFIFYNEMQSLNGIERLMLSMITPFIFIIYIIGGGGNL